jgi:hypothetical protein
MVIIKLLKKRTNRDASAKTSADQFRIATRTLRRWELMIQAQGFSREQRKRGPRHFAHRFSSKERQALLPAVNEP